MAQCPPPYASGYSMGEGVSRFLGVRRIFAQISPNLPEKNSTENDLQKTTACHFMCGAFFSIKALQAPFLPKFHPNLPKFLLTCPKRTEWKHDPQ